MKQQKILNKLIPFFSDECFPIRDSNVKGALFGLNLSLSRAHIARAVIEGITFTLRWILETLEDHNVSISEVRTGGGGVDRTYGGKYNQKSLENQ
jgi:xylulokinase